MVNEKILFVEDEELIGQDIKILLEDLGYDVVDIVPSGEEAISLAREAHADLVLMDIMLEGDIDGKKLLIILTTILAYQLFT